MGNRCIELNGRSAILEITEKCYCVCPWCYRKKVVSPKGEHVPLEILKRRIDWIRKYTDASFVCLVGGEPLLHPELKTVCKYIWQKGLRLSMITAGKISKSPDEQENLQFVLNLYKQGRIDLELSYQPGFNNEAFEKILTFAKGNYKSFRWGEKLFMRQSSSMDLTSTGVLNNAHTNPDIFKETRSFVGSIAWNEGFTSSLEADVQAGMLADHFEGKSLYTYFHHTKEGKKTFRYKIRYVGETQIDPDSQNHVIMPNSGICSAMKAKFSKKKISLPSITVRTDGEVCFSTAQCISGVSGLFNIDVCQTKEQIIKTASNTIHDLQRNVWVARRKMVGADRDQYCKMDPVYPDTKDSNRVNCPACVYKVVCNQCHETKRVW
jgi:organic radical activating enzyme